MGGSGSAATGYHKLSLLSRANSQEQFIFPAWLLSRCSGAWYSEVQKRRDGCRRYRKERSGILGCKGRKVRWELDGAGAGVLGKQAHSNAEGKDTLLWSASKKTAMPLVRQVPGAMKASSEN